jgi:deoxyribodipyrimidine photolyase
MSVTQGERYDKNAEFISLWCPELGELPVQTRHRPWEATDHEMRAAKLRLRGDARSQDSSEGGGCRCNDDETSQSASDAFVEYPAPMIDPAKQIGKRGKIA